jgi:predicted nucleic acid-binding Zn ribbon protein
MQLEKECKQCGARFLPKEKGRVFCCLECRKNWFFEKNLKNCLICGTPFSSRKKTYCSRACADLAAQRDPNGSGKACLHCGKSFFSVKQNAAYCSDECRISSNKTLRNFKHRGAKTKEKISIFAIAARDGWKCSICGRPINKDLDRNSKWAATIDHIVPLSKGGKHNWSNVRLAHRSCNSKKGDKLRPIQLHLNISLGFYA